MGQIKKHPAPACDLTVYQSGVTLRTPGAPPLQPSCGTTL